MSLSIKSSALLKVTDKAQEKIVQAAREYKEDNNLEELPAIRVAVKPGGCAGFSYELFFEEEVNKNNDEVLEFGDARVVVDSESKPLLQGTTLDYMETLAESGFKFDNPNATRTCGCGSSFG